MTPLYDVLSAWPIIGSGPNQLPYPRARLAMGVKSNNMHYRLRDIQPRHWRRLAISAGDRVWARMTAMADTAEAVLETVESELPTAFPAKLWEAVAAGIGRHAATFRSGVTRRDAVG